MLLDYFRRNKPRVVIAGVLLLITIISLVLFLTRPGKVTVSSENGAEIFIATKKGAGFKKIGSGTATYSTRKVPSDVYVMATKDGKKTISSAAVERGLTKQVTLKLSSQIKASPIINGSVSSVFFDGTLGQGIVPGDYSLINFRTDRADERRRSEFIGIPYVKKVVWYDANNFVYNSFRKGVGRFVNGQHLGNQGLADSVSGKDLTELDADGDGDTVVDLKDISRSGSNPLVLMSSRNIFLSTNLAGSLRSIVGFEPAESNNIGLFTSGNYIFRFAGDEPSAHATEGGASGATEETHTSTLHQYDYSGKEIERISVASESVRAVASQGEKVFVLTPESLISSEKGRTLDMPLYFTYARDIITYKNKVVLLGDGGLWQIGEDGVSIQLLYDFKDSGVGLAQSFSISGDSLIFGTQQRPEDTKNSSKMFATKL